MSESDTTPAASQLVLLIVAAFMLVTAISVLVMAFDFEGGSGLFPRLIGWIFVGLTSVEFVLQILRYKNSMNMLPAAVPHSNPEQKSNFYREISGILWLAAIAVGIYLVGFEITVPVYAFAFLRSGGNSLKKSATISICLSAILYLLFVVTLGHKLYPGILFGA